MGDDLTPDQVKAEILDLRPELLLACIERLDRFKDHTILASILSCVEGKLGWIAGIAVSAESIMEDHESSCEGTDDEADPEPRLCFDDALEGCRIITEFDWSHQYDAVRGEAYDQAMKLHRVRHKDWYDKHVEELADELRDTTAGCDPASGTDERDPEDCNRADRQGECDPPADQAGDRH